MLWKDGKKKAFTFSYDDGVVHDRRFVEILNKYGMKCTFNLNSECFEEDPIFIDPSDPVDENKVHRCIKVSEVKDLYKGHEVASHTCTHPRLVGMSLEDVRREVLDDKENLKKITGQTEEIIGFAYPYGAYDKELIERLRDCGIKYARTVCDADGFVLPEDFLEWHGTCHFKNPKLMELVNKFLASDNDGDLFYLWGHSYEFYELNKWDEIEALCKLLSEHKDEIWFATNREIYEYYQSHK